MPELWIPLTIAAAFLQNLRSAQQKHLTGRLSAGGAAYVRFLYAAPFALAYVALLAVVEGEPPPVPSGAFVAFAFVGGIAQVAATVLLLRSFATRSFAVGTAYSKTEAVQTAAYVRALGQIELLFSFAASILFFRESLRPLEIAGTFLLIGGIVLLVLG